MMNIQQTDRDKSGFSSEFLFETDDVVVRHESVSRDDMISYLDLTL